ncbi:MAG: YdcF family protein, partial [Chloroflexota bacterium]|nr:YdcF family protein [Chloroflexota bacterium]
ADLFGRDLVRYVVLTGGSNRTTGVQEALLHREILLERGVPEDRIILETRSVNTFQNVELTLPEIAARLDLGSIKAVTAVVKWYHSRRCLMILKRHLPAGVRYYVEPYEPETVTRSGWHREAYGRERVLKEWRYIPKYLDLGNLAEVREDDGAYV